MPAPGLGLRTALACLLLLASRNACGDLDEGKQTADSGTATASATWALEQLAAQLHLPPGFSASAYGLAKDARMMKLGLHNDTASIIYVSSNSGVVTALVSCHGNVSACELLINQGSPNGIAYANGSLWVATVPALTRWDGVDAAALAGCDAGMLSSSKVADLYPNPGHNSRALALGGDGKLYWGYGSVDNAGVCEPPICSIQRIGLDGSGQETFASNMRNPSGIAFHPMTGQLWFTNMGRDLMGNDLPDDTLVNPSSPGLNYEFPYCHWEGAGPPQQRDPGAGWLLADTSTPPPGLEPPPKGQGFNGSFGAWCGTHAAAPVQSLGPHVAPIGLAFYATNASGAFPHEWQGGWFVAEHGSRNRDKRIEGKAANHSIFVSGWLDDTSQTVWGRPVDVLVMPDSSLLVSDDQAGAVYRIAFAPGTVGAGLAPAPAPAAPMVEAAAGAPVP